MGSNRIREPRMVQFRPQPKVCARTEIQGPQRTRDSLESFKSYGPGTFWGVDESNIVRPSGGKFSKKFSSSDWLRAHIHDHQFETLVTRAWGTFQVDDCERQLWTNQRPFFENHKRMSSWTIFTISLVLLSRQGSSDDVLADQIFRADPF